MPDSCFTRDLSRKPHLVPHGPDISHMHDGLTGVDFAFDGAQLRAILFRASNPEPIPHMSMAKFLICPVASR